MFPDMTPLQYRKLQPLVKHICEKHGVLYVQENALIRTWKVSTQSPPPQKKKKEIHTHTFSSGPFLRDCFCVQSFLIASGAVTMNKAVAVLPPSVEKSSQFNAKSFLAEKGLSRDHGRKAGKAQ